MGIDPTYLGIVIVVILLSMTLHEAMHGFVAYWLGDDTAKNEGRLTLNPIAHIDPILTIFLPLTLALLGAPIFGGAKPVPFDPRNVRFGDFGAALVGIAGPLTNLILAFIFFAISVGMGQPIPYPHTDLLGQFIQTATLVNLGFFIFNMLPVPPLDGSRVLYALAPEPIKVVMENIEKFGLFVIFGLVLVFSDQLGQLIIGIMTAILRLFAYLFGIPVL
jgi:Zn-dependent protease